MKQIRVLLLFCSLILWIGAVNNAPIVEATGEAGGQVSINGKISFYEEATEPNDSISTEPSAERSVSSSTSKPNGKQFPSTGELVRNYGFIGGILLLVLLLFLRKRRKGEQK